jgi:protein subunit release factor B
MYTVIRNYQDEAPDVLEQIRMRADAIKEIIGNIEGFQAYYLVDTQAGGFATICVFEGRAGAEESTRAAAKWVAENIADWTPNPPTIIQGDVAIALAR